MSSKLAALDEPPIISFGPEICGDLEPALRREWLVTNGLGGYASGTLSGIATRRYHGLLIAALPAPLGRMVMFNHLIDSFRTPQGENVSLLLQQPDGGEPVPVGSLDSFSLEFGLPVWRYEAAGYVLEKRVVLPYRANTVHLNYRLIEGPTPIRLRLRPGFHFRPHEAAAT